MTEEIEHIRSLMEAEKFQEAALAINEAVAKNSDAPELLNLQGELMLKLGDLEAAKRIFSDIRKNHLDNLEASNNLAVCLIYENNWDKAINLLLEILRRDPSNATARENLNFIRNEVNEVNEKLVSEAKELMRRSLISEAEKNLLKVLSLNNKHVEASICLAAIKMKDGRFEKAEKMLTTISEIVSAPLKEIKNREEEEDTIERNMFWIFGSGRSGSSWLATQLLKHEGTICWDEPLIGSHLANIYWETDKNKRLLDRDAKRPDYFFSLDFSDIWKKYLRKTIIHRVFAQHPEALKKKIVIKEPNGSFAADIIMQTLQNSQIIFLIRDGRDIIDSTIDMYRKGSWAQNWVTLPELDEAGRRGLIKQASTSWRQKTEIVQKGFDMRDADKRLLMKYEDLRHDTFTQLKKIYTFVGISVSDEELRHIVNQYSFENIPKEQKGSGKAARKAKPGGYKESFSEEEIRLMNDIMGDQLKEFGYEV